MSGIESQLLAHPGSESLQFQVTTKDFLVQRCAGCNKKIELMEGDVIYGDKWFHGMCWKVINGGSKKCLKI